LLSATPKVASPEWSAVNLKHELVLFYADSLAQALRQEGVEVITSQDIGTLLGMERQRQLLACDDGRSCITELGDELQVAALDPDGLLVRQASGQWTRRQVVAGSSWCGVLASGQLVWLLGQDGVLWRFDLSATATTLRFDAGLARPPVDYAPKCGALAAQGLDGVWAGIGNAVSFVPFDGGAITALPRLPSSQVVGLLAADGRVLVSANNGDLAPGAVYELADGGWRPVLQRAGETVGGLAAGPDGGVWVTGSGSFVALLDRGGTVVEQLNPASFPNSQAAVDAVSLPDGRVWALFDSGAVVSHLAGTNQWVRQAPPWSSDDSQTSLKPSSIRASSTQLFITGTRSAILARPVP
jgi:hypothetical protein